jgi:hypothetical protein
MCARRHIPRAIGNLVTTVPFVGENMAGIFSDGRGPAR